MTEQQTKERTQNTLEMLLDRPKTTAFLILGIVAIMAMITQNDAEMLKYILSGCVTLAIVAGLFLDNE